MMKLTEEGLAELIPAIGIKNGSNIEYYLSTGIIQKQTDDLRKAIKGLLNVYACDNTAVRKMRISSVIEQITGKKYSEIGTNK